MCRFLLYIGEPVTIASLVTEPENSLIKQSYLAKERLEPLNGDGFGLAWYAPNIDSFPATFKAITPAWNNDNLLHIARVTSSPCILAHVRAATSSHSVTLSNCHPFSWKEYAFCHNGDIGQFKNIRRRLLADLSDATFNIVKGNTDSEHLFALFMDYLLKEPERETQKLQAMSNALGNALKHVVKLTREINPSEHCYMNIAATDGQRAVVSHCSTDPGYIDSLYLYTGHRYACVKGMTQVIPKKHASSDMVLVCSEPLTQDEEWHKVGLNRIMMIDTDRSVTSSSINFD